MIIDDKHRLHISLRHQEAALSTMNPGLAGGWSRGTWRKSGSFFTPEMQSFCLATAYFPACLPLWNELFAWNRKASPSVFRNISGA